MSAELDVLQERGFIHDVSDREGLETALADRLTFYSGFDPTGPSLHVGHLISIMAMRRLQEFGHRPLALVGAGTARIGDPSGKTSIRPMLDEGTIDANAAAIRAQLLHFLNLDGAAGKAVDNKNWLLDLRWIPFLREIGRHFSVNQMLAAEVYKLRLETGLSFIEFNYMLLQAYDFLHLFRTEQCLLYVGGSDQWSNSLAGVDLIRRVEAKKAYTLVTPLLTTASGQKMGKTEQGAVWLDAGLTPPYDYYQFWINTEDKDVERFLALYTELPMDEVRLLGRPEGADLRESKGRLAWEATAIAHGVEAADAAQEASQALFAGAGGVSAAPTYELSRDAAEDITAVELFIRAGLCGSRNDARRLIEQGGAAIDSERVAGLEQVVDMGRLEAGVLLRAGKKRYMRVVLSKS
ncbi:MAG TPA: tyrosine--tRNA ligase [Armatimonadota bacterium]|nr:tyrosine--tRNA ligase [Armatimonadota bacterium]